MANKLPWMKWFAADWLNDPQLSLCTPATRGVWSDLVSVMHLSGQTGELSGTSDQLARVARCSAAELAHALTDLRTTGAADVTERNGIVTVVNRRMSREHKKRQADAARQDRARRRRQSRSYHADDPPESIEVRGQKDLSDPNSNKNPSHRGRVPRSGSGVLKRDRTDVTLEVLTDMALLRKWFDEESSRVDAWVNGSPDDLANVEASAAKARTAHGIRDMVGLFKWLVKGRHWDFLRIADEEFAAAVRREAERTRDRSGFAFLATIGRIDDGGTAA